MQSVQVTECECALIRRDRYRRPDTIEVRFATAPQGLFEQRHVVRGQRIDQRRECFDRIPLIRIDAQPYVRPCYTNRLHARDIEGKVARQFQLERTRLRELPRTCRHDPRILSAQSERRKQRLRRRQAGQLPHRDAVPLRIEFPQRAVERIACPARRQEFLQLRAIDALFHHRAYALDGGHHARRRVIEVIHAGRLPSPSMLAIAESDYDHIQQLEDMAGDAKRRRQRQLLHLDLQRESWHQ